MSKNKNKYAGTQTEKNLEAASPLVFLFAH